MGRGRAGGSRGFWPIMALSVGGAPSPPTQPSPVLPLRVQPKCTTTSAEEQRGREEPRLLSASAGPQPLTHGTLRLWVWRPQEGGEPLPRQKPPRWVCSLAFGGD